jgi:hypothetical protein
LVFEQTVDRLFSVFCLLKFLEPLLAVFSFKLYTLSDDGISEEKCEQEDNAENDQIV